MENEIIERHIGWEKARDPFNFDEEDTNSDAFDAMEELGGGQMMPNVQAVMTPMGVVPITEHNNPYKVFNFWICHTDFLITQEMAEILDRTLGVETLDIFTPYRFRIAIGKCFKAREVKDRVKNQLGASLIGREIFEEDLENQD